MNSVISFIIVLGLLIFVHEFGHFLFAKLFGVKVLRFSLGFGPKLFGKQVGETEYLVSAFPLGGYVKMYGENPGDEVEAAEAGRAFNEKPLWQRFCIVAAGPVFNLLFAVLLFFLIYALVGLPKPIPGTKIGQVAPDSPAAKAGIVAGDVIRAIDGKPISEWEQISEIVRQGNGAPVTLILQRGSESVTVTGTPTRQEVKNIFGEKVGERYLLGISRSEELIFEKVSLLTALGAGFSQTWNLIYLTLLSLLKIIQKVVPASELGGPILIAQLAGQQMEAGWMNLVYFMGLLSVNLGILNLFPIPILDGGHLLFFTVEGIMRRPLSMKTRELLQQIGLVLLISLMFFVFYNDIMRLIGRG
ncbi:MAG: RIP metalloprotease RseP [Thermodesulfobacteriota bacterium]